MLRKLVCTDAALLIKLPSKWCAKWWANDVQKMLGVPLGARLAQKRPGVREIRINYCGGHYYNLGQGRFALAGAQRRPLRLYQHKDALVLDLPSASEAIVPQRSRPWPPPARNRG